MTNLLFPLVSSSLGAAAEALTLAAQVLAVILGVRFIADVLDILARIVAALRWLAGLVQLTVMLLCSVVGDLAPVVGRYAGRAAGRAVRLGRQARALYNARLAPIVTAADYTARAFVTAQLGTTCPQLQQAIAPAQVLSLCIAPVQPEPEPVVQQQLTRRQLLTLAREARLPRYSRMTTQQLQEALAV